ncbi:MAG: acyl-CoA dehydrogenase family protein [Dehalococcoidia bacterium]
MDVLLNEEEDILRRSAREFLEGVSPPSLARAMESDDLGYSPEVWKQLAALDWLGLALPAEYGGQGLGMMFLGIFVSELGRAITPVPFHSTMTAALTVATDGSEQQKSELLPRVVKGDAILTWAFTEDNPRLVPGVIQMSAAADGDGYVLNGAKMFVENANIAEQAVVVARTAAASAANEGLSVFLVNLRAEGVAQTPLVTLARDKQSKVTFTNVRVPASALIGGLNQGWPVAQRMLEKATVMACALITGATRHQLETAVEYAKNRVAFGRPIGTFQSIAHTLADMVIWVDGGELLTNEALWRMDMGLLAHIEVSQAKAFCNDKCVAAARFANMIHGGIAFIAEFDLNLWYRRIVSWAVRLGTSFDHRAHVATELLDRPGHVQLGESLYDLAPAR